MKLLERFHVTFALQEHDPDKSRPLPKNLSLNEPDLAGFAGITDVSQLCNTSSDIPFGNSSEAESRF